MNNKKCLVIAGFIAMTSLNACTSTSSPDKDFGAPSARYGDVDVTRPELQIPDSVQPLFDTWLRDTYVMNAPDGYYYMTGTISQEGRITAYDQNPGIQLWRSKDLKNWEDLGVVWDFDKHGTWQKDFYITDGTQKVDLNKNPVSNKRRTLWAPELHYIASQKNYFLVGSMPLNPKGSGSFVLRSTTGKAEGPYENIEGNSDGFLHPRIDGSLFEDDDGSVYFVAHNHEIAKMKADMSDIAEPFREIDEQEYDIEPYIEGAYIFKDEGKYHLVQAIWSFQLPDGRYAYDEEKPGRAFKSNKEIGEARYSYDVVIATADNVYGPYSKRYTSVIGAGHNNLFQDKQGNWWATMFGNPRGDLLERKFVTRPAIIPMQKINGYFFPLQDKGKQ